MNDTPPSIPLQTEEIEDLRDAKRKLETPSLTVELAALIGQPLEAGIKLLPKRFGGQVQAISQMALVRAMDVAVGSLANRKPMKRSEAMHRWMSAGTGAIGGAVGLWSLPVEIPISTTLILRSIADIARDEGHDLARLETRMACLEVFALGGISDKDNAAESSYWLIRGSLSKAFADAATYFAERTAVSEGAPPLVRLAASIASRFSLTFSAQAAARAIPLLKIAQCRHAAYLHRKFHFYFAGSNFLTQIYCLKFNASKSAQMEAAIDIDYFTCREG